jgi:hypothetical protein
MKNKFCSVLFSGAAVLTLLGISTIIGIDNAAAIYPSCVSESCAKGEGTCGAPDNATGCICVLNNQQIVGACS